MSDTRNEFEGWWNSDKESDGTSDHFNDSSAKQSSWEVWQACQQLNDMRLEQLLALAITQREALNKVNNTYGSLFEAQTIAEKALSIQPEGLKLEKLMFPGQYKQMWRGWEIQSWINEQQAYTVKKTESDTNIT